ncbi:MAG: type II toxin-antitoxin system RelE/ParE family toxin [Thiobacillus sp.]
MAAPFLAAAHDVLAGVWRRAADGGPGRRRALGLRAHTASRNGPGCSCNVAYVYIAQDNPRAAAALILEADESTRLLARHPDMGRPGRVPGTREWVLPHFPCIIPCRVRNNGSGFFACFMRRENGRGDLRSRKASVPTLIMTPSIRCACATKQHFSRCVTEKTTALLARGGGVWIIDRVHQAHTRAGQLCRAFKHSVN